VGGVQITGIDGVQIISGSGPVNVVTPTAFVGDLAPNATSAPVAIVFTWPASISRLRFTVHFSADGGAYSGSTVLTVSF
jgi:hypothetical protein